MPMEMTPDERHAALAAIAEFGPPVLIVSLEGDCHQAVQVHRANSTTHELLGYPAHRQDEPIWIVLLAGGPTERTNWAIVAARLIAANPATDSGWHTATLDTPAIRTASCVSGCVRSTAAATPTPTPAGHARTSPGCARQLRSWPTPRTSQPTPNTGFRTLRTTPSAESSSTIVEALERSDAFRRPERFELLLQAFEAVYPTSAERFRKALQAAAEVDAGALASLHRYDASEIPRAVRQARVVAVSRALHSGNQNSEGAPAGQAAPSRDV